VVELVDDDDVEVIGREVGEAGGVEALDGGEDVVEAGGPAAADPELAEGVVAQGVAEGGERLEEDLLAVGDEEEACAGRKAQRRASSTAAMTVLPVPVAETRRFRWRPSWRARAICSSRRSWKGSRRISMGLRRISGAMEVVAERAASSAGPSGTKSPPCQ
jgi:hypothetical protein